jgi:uncharacterized SAM-binding protein YcdF (DUF218 family)
MKNRTAAYILLAAGLAALGYFTALKISSPGFIISFTCIWFVAGIVSLAACFLFFRRSKNGKAECRWWKHLPGWARKTMAFAAAAGVLAACISLYYILTPRLSDGHEKVSYLIILGGGIRQDATLGPVPLKRIKKAAEYMKVHPEVKAVVTGGKGPFEPCTEALVMAKALAAQGISETRILQEDRARDTIQNFSYSAQIASADAAIPISDFLASPIAVVTSDYHLTRAERLARREGYAAVYGIASKTPVLFIPDTYSREICSYIKLELRILLTGKPAAISTGQ